jgi:outer membrane immunogenic protein
MKRFFNAIAAPPALLAMSVLGNAADFPRSPLPPPPTLYAPPPFCWTGFYFGGNVGGAWIPVDMTDNLFGLTLNDRTKNGVFMAGVQFGINAQFSNFVFGAEGDLDWVVNSNNSRSGVVPGIGTIQATYNSLWVSTLAARFGVAVDRWLVYGKAGGGWIGHDTFTVINISTGKSISGSDNSGGEGGWLIGAGLEWAFSPSLSARIEYNYLGLTGRTFVVPETAPLFANDTFTVGSRGIQMAKVAINYRFNLDNSSGVGY